MLFTQRQLNDVSVSEIARAAGVYPNQVTYYFGSKDSLFIHAAFLALLHDAGRLEPVGYRMKTADAFRGAISRTILSLPSMPTVVQALAVGTAKPDLAGVLGHHLHLLFRQSERYLDDLVRDRSWSLRRPLRVETRTFWSAAFGAVLLAQAGVPGTSAELDLAGTLTIHEN